MRTVSIYLPGQSTFIPGITGRLKRFILAINPGGDTFEASLETSVVGIDLPAGQVLSGATPVTGLIARVNVAAAAIQPITIEVDVAILKTTVMTVNYGMPVLLIFEVS